MPVSPALAENLAAEVVGHYQEAERQLLARIAKNLASGISGPHWAEQKYAQLLAYQRQTERLIADLRKQSATGVRSAIVAAYERGGLSAVADISRGMRVQTLLSSELDVDNLLKAVKGWGGERSVVAETALRFASRGKEDAMLVYAADGRLAGLATFSRSGEDLTRVYNLATNPDVPGSGRILMQNIAKTAAAEGREITLHSLPEAEGFYEHLGLVRRKPGSTIFGLDAAQTAKFASTGLTEVEHLAGLRAVEAMAQETLGYVSSTHPRILRSTMDAYRAAIEAGSKQEFIGSMERVAASGAARDIVAENAQQALLGVQTRRQATQAALDAFAKKGITGFIDKSGRGWNLESYVETAMRTGCGKAAVQGHVDRLTENGLDLVIVSDAPRECPLCRPWEGKVLSIGSVPVEMPPETDPAFTVEAETPTVVAEDSMSPADARFIIGDEYESNPYKVPFADVGDGGVNSTRLRELETMSDSDAVTLGNIIEDAGPDYPSNFSAEQSLALSAYKGGGDYHAVNQALMAGRTNVGLPGLGDIADAMDIDEALVDRVGGDALGLLDASMHVRPTSRDWTLYRSEFNVERLGDFSVGDVISDPAFMSTTASRDFAENWVGTKTLFSIDTPKGTPGVWIDQALGGVNNQFEYLLARGTRFRVVADLLENGRRHVRLAVVPK